MGGGTSFATSEPITLACFNASCGFQRCFEHDDVIKRQISSSRYVAILKAIINLNNFKSAFSRAQLLGIFQFLIECVTDVPVELHCFQQREQLRVLIVRARALV